MPSLPSSLGFPTPEGAWRGVLVGVIVVVLAVTPTFAFADVPFPYGSIDGASVLCRDMPPPVVGLTTAVMSGGQLLSVVVQLDEWVCRGLVLRDPLSCSVVAHEWGNVVAFRSLVPDPGELRAAAYGAAHPVFGCFERGVLAS